MSTPYRSDVEALTERRDALEQEIGRLKEQTRSLEGLRSREEELERELASVTQRIGARATRALPMLDQVRVASPCSASWDEMLGDERVRFCLQCEKNVYNLSAMPRDEAERLLQERAGGSMCVRFYQRADGTVLTEDCPVGVKRRRRKKIALAVAGAGAMALAATSALARTECRSVQGGLGPVTGELAVQGQVEAPSPPKGSWTMGDRGDGFADRQPEPSVPAPPTAEPGRRPPIMGRIPASKLHAPSAR